MIICLFFFLMFLFLNFLGAGHSPFPAQYHTFLGPDPGNPPATAVRARVSGPPQTLERLLVEIPVMETGSNILGRLRSPVWRSTTQLCTGRQRVAVPGKTSRKTGCRNRAMENIIRRGHKQLRDSRDTYLIQAKPRGWFRHPSVTRPLKALRSVHCLCLCCSHVAIDDNSNPWRR